VGCSDGSNSSVLWGISTLGKDETPFEFVEGAFGSSCRGFDVAFGPGIIYTLNFTSCGGGVEGGYFPTTPSASLRCPSGMQVVGLHGVINTWLIKVGLYCMRL
jgi:hypothetical protein